MESWPGRREDGGREGAVVAAVGKATPGWGWQVTHAR